MSIEKLDEALKGMTPRPKAIQVGIDLGKDLENHGRIKRKSVTIQEYNKIYDPIKLPFLDEDIFIEVCPWLGPCEYALPSEDR